MTHFCPSCAHPVSPEAAACPQCGHPLKGAKTKSKLTAVLLGIFLGQFGAHRFYLGDPGRALLMFFGFWFTFWMAIISMHGVAGVVFLAVVLACALDVLNILCRGEAYYRAKAQQ